MSVWNLWHFSNGSPKSVADIFTKKPYWSCVHLKKFTEITGGAVEDLAISKDASQRSTKKQIHRSMTSQLFLEIEIFGSIWSRSCWKQRLKPSNKMLCLRFLVHNNLNMWWWKNNASDATRETHVQFTYTCCFNWLTPNHYIHKNILKKCCFTIAIH